MIPYGNLDIMIVGSVNVFRSCTIEETTHARTVIYLERAACRGVVLPHLTCSVVSAALVFQSGRPLIPRVV